MLLEVRENGMILVLIDGSQLMLEDPSDVTMTILWIPTAELEITPLGGDLLRVKNLEDNETVLARRIS